MVATRPKPELIAIVGPTASGKSALALRIALNYNGEIIAADSRTVYKGLNIGTAKPSLEEQKQVRHWGLDLVEPGEKFTAYQFQKYAAQAIFAIRERGKLPILVGGTGLYIDAVLLGFEFRAEADPKVRSKLESISTEQLREIIRKAGYKMPENVQNRRHLIRTIETKGDKPAASSPQLLQNSLVIGLMPADEALKANIEKRATKMFKRGVLEETHRYFSSYNEVSAANAGIIYKLCLRAIKGEIDEKEALELFKTADWQYARRQRTWLRRNKFIHWFQAGESAYRYVRSLLNT